MNVLAIDTSNQVMGVAIGDEHRVLGEIITNMKKNHSVRLMPAVDMLLDEVQMQPSDLDRIAVACGPGSYTGVRIGVSVAKTMAWSLQIPLVGISSLEALAMNGWQFSGYICPLFDARRGRVYAGLYASQHHDMKQVWNERIMLLTDWLAQCQTLDQDILFIGQDVQRHQQTIAEMLGSQAVFAATAEHNPRPGELALLAMDRKPVAVIHDFVPEYLQMAEAEAKWQAKQRENMNE